MKETLEEKMRNVAVNAAASVTAEEQKYINELRLDLQSRMKTKDDRYLNTIDHVIPSDDKELREMIEMIKFFEE
jgi:ribosomal protein L4